MKSKAWTAEEIRKLARKRLAEVDGENQKLHTIQQGLPETEATPPTKAPRVRETPVVEGPEFFWGRFERQFGRRVLLVLPESLKAVDDQELGRLCETLGLESIEAVSVRVPARPKAATLLPRGFLESLSLRAAALGVDAVVLDFKLTPVQVRNLEDIMKKPVLDRHALILSIFKHHAQTRLAKMQVELAQLKYLQSRLSGIWSGLSRQRGAKGGQKGRGLGETRLELDRRVIKDRISILNRRLDDAAKSFEVQSQRRQKLPRVALVGYTNAGKSSLMSCLTKSEVEQADRLFCTLDTTVRALKPPTNPQVLVSDTVGFVRDLPHDLVHSFKSTLREALESDLLLHVIDTAHPACFDQFEVAEDVLNEIGAEDRKRIFILNKADLLGAGKLLRLTQMRRRIQKRFPNAKIMVTSVVDKEGLRELKSAIVDSFQAKAPEWEMAR